MVYYAVCGQNSGQDHPIGGSWSGPRRATKAEAQKDADDHKTKTGHVSTIMESQS